MSKKFRMGSVEQRTKALQRLYDKLRPIMKQSKDGLAVYRYGGIKDQTPAFANLDAWWHRGRPKRMHHRWSEVPLKAIINSIDIPWEPHKPYSPLEKLALEAE